MSLLYVLCEGDDDEQFFKNVVEPRLPHAKHEVDYFQYGQCTHEDVRNLLRSIHGMQENGIDANYLFLSDYDDAPCKTSRFDEVDRKYDELISRDRTFLVVQNDRRVVRRRTGKPAFPFNAGQCPSANR